MPEEFIVKRDIIGDPLENMPELDPNPPEFTPGEHYTVEWAEIVEKNHNENFLLPDKMWVVHNFMKKQEMGFAWELNEMGHLKRSSSCQLNSQSCLMSHGLRRIFQYLLAFSKKYATLSERRLMLASMNLQPRATAQDGSV